MLVVVLSIFCECCRVGEFVGEVNRPTHTGPWLDFCSDWSLRFMQEFFYTETGLPVVVDVAQRYQCCRVFRASLKQTKSNHIEFKTWEIHNCYSRSRLLKPQQGEAGVGSDDIHLIKNPILRPKCLWDCDLKCFPIELLLIERYCGFSAGKSVKEIERSLALITAHLWLISSKRFTL